MKLRAREVSEKGYEKTRRRAKLKAQEDCRSMSAKISKKLLLVLALATFAKGGVFAQERIRTTGTLWAWGWNGGGQLGDGTGTGRSVPVLIQLGTTWTSVSAGTDHSTAVREDGTLWAWGLNSSG